MRALALAVALTLAGCGDPEPPAPPHWEDVCLEHRTEMRTEFTCLLGISLDGRACGLRIVPRPVCVRTGRACVADPEWVGPETCGPDTEERRP